MPVPPARDSYDLASGLRDRLSDGVQPEPVSVVIPELQRLAREHLGEDVQVRAGEADEAIDIRVRAWSVGPVRRSSRPKKP
ncbi:MAG TPA: hypothetical protein VIB62_08090 [Actinomycetota bacterium]|jgi:hypothetical protein